MIGRSSMFGKSAAVSSFETETVWNSGLEGTGEAAGHSLAVGRDAEWLPEHLLLLAAEACFMSTLLALAAAEGIDVMGYVSSGHLRVPADRDAVALISLEPCAIVTSTLDADRLSKLGVRAQQESVTARLLGSRLQVTMDVQTIPAEAPVQ
jgi:organic hydroperoxide reductase OsmC/OhrA